MENRCQRLVVCCFNCAASAIAASLLQVLNGMTLSIEWYHVASLCQDMVAEPLCPCSCCCRSSNSCKIKSNTSENPDRCMHRIKGGGGRDTCKKRRQHQCRLLSIFEKQSFQYNVGFHKTGNMHPTNEVRIADLQFETTVLPNTHTHTRTSTHARTHACTNACTNARTNARTNTLTHRQTHAHI